MANIFSLVRLQKLLKSEGVPHRVSLGARLYESNSNQMAFYGQGYWLKTKSFSGFKPGDFVVFETDLSNIQFDERKTFTFYRETEADLHVSGTSGELEPSVKVSVETIKLWEFFLDEINRACTSLGLQRVSTPSLVECPGTEPTLVPFLTEFNFGQLTKTLYLPTSPELHLKKYLSSDWTDIFEMRRCFRNEELSRWHEPEFNMLEWYRAFADLELIEEDLKTLVSQVGKNLFGGPVEFQKISVAQLFADHLDFGLTPQTSLNELIHLASQLGIDFSNESWEDLFHRIFVLSIEPHVVSGGGATIVYDYPWQLAALAKINDKGWADRFELYFGGFEIANAFNELTNYEEHLVRLQRDGQQRAHLGHQALPRDEQFLRAIKSGIPMSGGIALGLDRLFMAFTGNAQIKQIRPFTFAEKMKGQIL